MNRRKTLRIKTKLLCKFWDNQSNIHKGTIRDLSKAGLKLVGKIGSLPIGLKSLEIFFQVPVSHIDLAVKARIRWKKLTDTTMEAGLEFVNIKNTQKITIDQFANAMR